MTENGIGASVLRKEDQRFLTGLGNYVDDINRPGQTYASFVLLGISVPNFVAGSALLILFAVYLPLAPIGGWGSLAHLPLPVATLALPYTAYIARLTRVAMLDALSGDFVRTALAKSSLS